MYFVSKLTGGGKKKCLATETKSATGDRSERDELKVWDWHMYSGVYGMIDQWGPAG